MANDNDSKDHLSFNSEHRLRAENLPFDIDVWYPVVKPFTFPSVFLPLQKSECKAIQAAYNVGVRGARKLLTREEIEILKNLQKSLDEVFDEHFSENGKGAFVRLCGRSPKDGEPYNMSQVYKEYQKHLEDILPGFSPGDTVDIKAKMTAIARTSWLKVRSGADVLSLLLTSERVYADMLDWERFGEPEQICLRHWDENITMDYEFRVFVNEEKITAISQYDHYLYYPHLEDKRDTIEEAIRKFWKDVHIDLDIKSYVIDIAYVPTSGQCIMIELSPFLACTGSALFSWSVESDLMILEGRKPFEFRLKKESDLHPHLEDLLELNWDGRWNCPANFPRYDTYLQTSTEDYEAMCRHDNEEKTRTRRLKMSIGLLMCGGIATSYVFPQSTNNCVFAWALLTGLTSLCGFLGKPLPKSAFDESRTVKHSDSDGDKNTHLLFVYGTLKRNFQWNTKYLHSRVDSTSCSNAKFLTSGTTYDKHVLLVGDCGVPYLSLKEAANSSTTTSEEEHGHVVGELWNVSQECLNNLDDYEGIRKGYYKRELISVIPDNTPGKTEQAFVYYLATPREELLKTASVVQPTLRKAPGTDSYPVVEYTLHMHRTLYNPVRHIQVKQLGYIDHNPSSWGHSLQPQIEISTEATTCNVGE